RQVPRGAQADGPWNGHAPAPLRGVAIAADAEARRELRQRLAVQPSPDFSLDDVLEPADSRNLDLDPVAGLHRPHARRRTGYDDVAGFERHDRADELDDEGGREDHVRGDRILPDDVVLTQADALDVGIEIGLDPGAHRLVGIEGLRAGELL